MISTNIHLFLSIFFDIAARIFLLLLGCILQGTWYEVNFLFFGHCQVSRISYFIKIYWNYHQT
jgi:hypothetical protein